MRRMLFMAWFAQPRPPAERRLSAVGGRALLIGLVGLCLAACGGETSGAGDVVDERAEDVVDDVIDTAPDAPGDADVVDAVDGNAIEDADAVADADAASDLAGEPDAALPRGRNGLALTGGGGLRSSANYTLLVAVGPAMPAGAAESTHYRLQLGPRAVQP